MRSYRCPTVPGFSHSLPSGTGEKIRALGTNFDSTAVARSTQRRWYAVARRSSDHQARFTDHGQPHEHAPIRVLPRLHDDPRGLLRGRRLRVGPRCGGLGSLGRRVDRNPAPPDGACQSGAQYRVDVPNRGRRERPADMDAASVVAVVPALDSVAVPLTTVTTVTAATEGGIERLQCLRVDPADLHTTEYGPDMPVQFSYVPTPRRGLQLHDLQEPVQKLVEGRPGTRITPLVHLSQQSRPHLLGLPGRRGAGRHGLHEVVLLLGHGVDTRVHPHAQ
jgi:hypothetical protein